MTPAVIDSSVAYKWLSQDGENGLEQAFAVLWSHRSSELTLVAPAIIHVELANSLRYSKYVTEEDTLTLVGALNDLEIGLIDSTSSRLMAAIDLSYRHALSVYDALFLALAEELGCPLISADRKAFADIATDVEIRLI